jgi:cyclic pyranopterin phosphate synthase
MQSGGGCGTLTRLEGTFVSVVPIRVGGLKTSPAQPARELGEPLVDRYGRVVRYLRVSLTDRCNYRCTYCMPERGVVCGPRDEVMTLEEVAWMCSAFARLGVERVRLTGGEPTIRRGLTELVARLARIPGPRGPLEIVMTTNGDRLAGLAHELAAAGLRSVTTSLDSLDPERFRTITRRGDLDRVVAGIDTAVCAGLHPVKLNTVALRGFNDDELAALAEFAWSRGCVPRFIELMPMAEGELYVPGGLMPAAEIRARIASELDATIASDAGAGIRGPATYWRVLDGPHAGRRFGTIAAVSDCFCATCNRLRASATGQLHACLARDEHWDLRAAVRSGDAARFEATVRRVVHHKPVSHGFALDGSGGPTKAMVTIGG